MNRDRLRRIVWDSWLGVMLCALAAAVVVVALQIVTGWTPGNWLF